MSELPKILGYKIEKKLGQGGMADVYLGIQENLERKVAVKILIPELFRDSNFAKRFLKEAQTAGKLVHPNIITIHDIGQFEKNYYIVMEYLETSLKDKVKSGPIAPDEALDIVAKVASALDYAHKKGFIHRDIKPDNIMFREDGTPVLVDFGIARALGSTTKLTKTGMSIGTPHYMSPEQARGKVLDGRSDIYSLGVVFYEMLTGKVPYEAEDSDSIAIAIKHIQEPIPKLANSIQPSAISRFKNEELEKLQALINKMMAKDPEDRAQSGREVMELISKETGGRRQEIGEGNEPSAEYVEVKYTSPEKIKPGEEILSAGNLDSPHKRDNKRNKTIKILASVLSVSLIVLLLFLFSKESKKKIDKENWAEAMRVHSIYSFENYLGKNPDGQYSSKARWWINSLKAETEARKRKEDEKQKSNYSSSASANSSGYGSSRVTLRSSYKTISSDSDVKAMLKRRGFFDSSNNKGGDFNNDFRSKAINGDKVVIDSSTGLMWHQSGSSFNMTFSEAEEWIRDLNRRGYAGHYGWRLPTLEEAASLLEQTEERSGLYIDPVFSSKQRWIWTGDKYSSNGGWVVSFSFGLISRNNFDDSSYVRPVRRDN